MALGDNEIVITGSTIVTMRLLGVGAVIVLGSMGAAGTEQSAPVPPRGGLAGQVLAPDGSAVVGARTRVLAPGWDTAGTADESGRFRMGDVHPGSYELQASAPGLAPGRWKVMVPASGRLTLPPIRLSQPTWFRARLVSPAGDPIVNPRMLARVYDSSGREIPADLSTQTDLDGLTSIGPLPRGIFVLAVDAPPWARTRLPDVIVTGETPYLDAGTVRLEPGVAVEVDVRDEAGAPVPHHEVLLDDLYPFSPAILPAFTNAGGRARFERVASGRYFVKTRASRRCGPFTPIVQRGIAVRGVAPTVQPVAISGVSVGVRVTSAGAPLAGAEVSLSSDLALPVMPPWFKNEDLRSLWRERRSGPLSQFACGGQTDGDGRTTIRYVPSGAARVSVGLPSSTWTGRVMIPSTDGEILLEIPTGVVALRVLDQQSEQAVSGAEITWSSGGNQVEAAVPPTGDVLLDGIAEASADLVVLAPGHVEYRAAFPAPPPVLHTIALQRLPERSLRCRVESDDGTPRDDAVLEIVPADPLEATWFAGTDSRGQVHLSGLPLGAARLTVTAPGHKAVVTAVTVPADRSGTLLVRIP